MGCEGLFVLAKLKPPCSTAPDSDSGGCRERGWLQAEETHLVDRADKMIPPDQREARRAAGQGAVSGAVDGSATYPSRFTFDRRGSSS